MLGPEKGELQRRKAARKEGEALALWAQFVGGVWSLSIVLLFLRQIAVAYVAALFGA